MYLHHLLEEAGSYGAFDATYLMDPQNFTNFGMFLNNLFYWLFTNTI